MKKLIILLYLTIASLCSAQDDELFVLSPFSVDLGSSDGYRATDSLTGTRVAGLPPIVLTKKADYFAIQFDLINDSRLPEDRSRELHTTVLDILKKAKAKSLVLQYGKDVIDESNYQIQDLPYAGKPDTTYIRLLIKVVLEEDDDVSELTHSITRFLAEQKMEGRSYPLVTSSGLSIKNPQSYRYELLKLIAEDIEKVKSMFTGELTISVLGLDQRIIVRQASDRNVDLYVPYTFEFLNEREEY